MVKRHGVIGGLCQMMKDFNMSATLKSGGNYGIIKQLAVDNL